MSQSATPAPTNIPYLGLPEQNPRDTFYRPRAPTTKDYSIYRVGDRWVNRPSQTAYILVSKANGVATWTMMASAAGPIMTINSQPPVANNMNFVNSGAVAIGSLPGVITLGVKVDGVTVQIIGDQLVAGGAVPTTFVTDAGNATPVANILNVLGTPAQGISTAGAGNTVTITAADASAVQKGVATFDATNFTVAAGNVTSNPITVTSPLGTLTIGGSPVNLGGALTLDLAGGSIGVDSIGVQASTAPGTNPVLPTAGGLVTINGAAVAAAGIPVQSNSLAANTLQIEVQRASQQALSSAANAGLASFNNLHFTVDGNGWVSNLNGLPISSVDVDGATAPGTDPVLPTALGVIGVGGAQVAAGTVPSAIRTQSIAANSYQIQVQRSSAQAISSVTQNGVCHFDSADFTVDANGFVSAITSVFTWQDFAGGALAVSNGYFATAAAVYTLPAGTTDGESVEIIDNIGGGVVVTAQGGNTIRIQNTASSANGTAVSSQFGDALRLIYRASISEWQCCPGGGGMWTLA